jgi:RNA polymerase sigma factor (sigma-70 family)
VREPQQTVFVVDDDTSHLSSMERLLCASGYRVECFSTARELIARLSTPALGCIITDLKMPEMDGVELQRAHSQSENPLPIVFLTGYDDVRTGVAAMRGGAEDFLVKTAPAGELLAAIERALARGRRESEERARERELRARFDRLTPREREVLAHVFRGRLNKQIAADLGIAERSVKRHRTNLMRKLEVDSVAELVQLALKAGVN